MTTYSDNGWPVVGPDSIDAGFSVAGVTFPGGVRAGNVAAVFQYLCEQLNARVEPIVAGWCWGYEQRDNVNNPGNASCHASGTAIDWNAPSHANGARGTFSTAQVATIRAIMAECPAFLWGGDFTGTPDEMHWQIANDTADDDLAAIVAGLPGQGDWFAMASKEDLRDVVDASIEAHLDEIQSAVWSFKETYHDHDQGKDRTLSIHDMIGEIRGQV